MAKKDNEKAETEGAAVETTDSPLLDLTDAAVKRMIKLAKKRGFVTYRELNAVLPSEEVNSEQIEDILAMLNEMGINVIESEEPEEADAEEGEEEEIEGGELVEVTQPKAPATKSSEPADRTDDPVRMYLREMGSRRTSLARRRDCDCQAHRGRPRGDDRRALREPADVPGNHHLARRIERRQGSAARHHRSRSDLRRARRQEHAEDRHDRAGRRRKRSPRSARPRPRRSPRPPAFAPPAKRAKPPVLEESFDDEEDYGEFRVALRHGGRTQAEGARHVRPHRRRL